MLHCGWLAPHFTIDFSSNLETDWSSDTGGCKPREGMLGEEAFKRSWFELADVYTNAVDAAEYAEFLRGIIATISIVESDAPAEDRQQRGQTPMPTRSLTSDAQLLDLLKKRIPPEGHREYRVRRQKWEEAFPADYAAWRWREPRQNEITSRLVHPIAAFFVDTHATGPDRHRRVQTQVYARS